MKKIVIASMLAMGMVSGAAYADVTAQSGIYIGANAGWSFADSPSASDAGASSVSNKNYVLGATVGYDYAFTQNWLAGLEIGYTYFGKQTYDYTGSQDGSFTNTGFQLMATGTYLDSSGFNVFGKVGAVDEKTAVSDPSDNLGDTSQTKWLPAAAIGVGYMPMQNLNVALQYERTFGASWSGTETSSDTPSKPMTQNAVTLGVTYKFGM